MRILYFCALLLLSCAVPAVAAEKSYADKDKITRTLQTILPGETITGINSTPIADLYEVSLGPEIIYMSGDGRYVFRAGSPATVNSPVEARCPPEVAGNS